MEKVEFYTKIRIDINPFKWSLPWITKGEKEINFYFFMLTVRTFWTVSEQEN